MTDDIDLRHTLRLVRPRTPNQLHAYVRAVLGFDIPRRPLIAQHQAPFDYLTHAFFEPPEARALRTPRDCIVWANRGGGKTQLGAIATLLDLVFKPGIQIRILAGSFEQSSRMYAYLKRMLSTDTFADLIDGSLTGRFVQLRNGSRVEVLSQSECAIRGNRVHRLRCDEVELFEPEIWQAAQLVTRSGRCGDVYVRGAIEAISTMHRPHGLMRRLLDEAATAQRTVIRWSVLDTLARCEPRRDCTTCPLWTDCRGRAKSATGFISIDDALVQHARVDPQAWQAEMLCERPSRAHQVYPGFDPAVHVTSFDERVLKGPGGAALRGRWVAGVDFGYRSPTVYLLAHLDEAGVLRIVDELVARGETTQQIIERARALPWPRPRWVGADPAGHQRSEQTGLSSVALWQRAGFNMRTAKLRLADGLQAVRARLRAADGTVRLFIHPRCAALIEALTLYHYPDDQPDVDEPVKDGPDHAADALRYLIINLDRAMTPVIVQHYI